MDNSEAPRRAPMAEEASGETESMDEPRIEEEQLQESFESPPRRRGDRTERRAEFADMKETSADMERD